MARAHSNCCLQLAPQFISSLWRSSKKAGNRRAKLIMFIFATLVASYGLTSLVHDMGDKPARASQPVAMRAVVITGGKRLTSLYRLLNSLCLLVSDGDRIDTDVWIDIPPGFVSASVYAEKQLLKADIENLGKNGTYRNGVIRAHIWDRHMGLRGQWLDAWHASLPDGLSERTKEVGVILEDDLEVSPFAWRWLKGAYHVYGADPRVAGFSLMRVEHCAAKCPNLEGGPDGAGGAFFYPLIGTWGYSPTAKSFSRFRNWYYSLPPDYKPYVDNITPTEWYQNFEKAGTEKKRMWEMHHIKYTDTHEDKYTVYVKCFGNAGLSVNHREVGLNFPEKMVVTETVLQEWSPEYVQFPKSPFFLNYSGVVISGKGAAGGIV